MVKSPIAYCHAGASGRCRMITTSASNRCGLLRRGMAAVLLLGGMVFGLAAPAWAQAPVVNGQFYGDGDDNRYPSTPYATSANGSKLYVTLVNGTLYVALVVDRSFNDNVFDSQNGSAYLNSAGWGSGGNKTARRRMDSEFAEFELTIGADGDPNQQTFVWQQGYAGQPDGNHDRTTSNYISDTTVSGGGGTPPPNVDSASSMMWNLNNYADSLIAGTNNWTMPGTNTNADSWKSPWRGADGSGTPPEDTTTVIDANEGYPSTGQITYSSTYEWEWSMIYEWSLDLTQFGANPLFVIAGSSHHSPSKKGPEDDEFPPDDDPLPQMDLGDLPDSYQTLLASDGARHVIDTSVDIRLGENVDTETNGQPGAAADSDDLQTVDDEDGVSLPDSTLGEGDPAVYTATVTATNDNGNGDAAFVCGWFDMDQNGTFDNSPNTSTSAGDPGFGAATDSGDRSCISIPDGTIDEPFTLSWTIPTALRGNDGNFYFRFRISTDPGLLNTPSPAGVYHDGEVEDYRVSISSLPVTLNSFESRLTGSRLRVEWTTASETFNMGFNLWAQVDDAWRLLTPDPVLAKDGDAVTPQEYKHGVVLRDIDPRSIQGLALSSIGMDGGQELYGSFAVGRSYGERALPEPIAWEAVRAELDASMRGKGYEKSGNKWRRGKSGNKAGAASASSGAPAAAEVSVTTAGMQRVTYDALRAAGLDLAGARADAIAVTLKGEGVPRVINTGRSGGGFGPGGYIDFWGSKPDYPDALYVSDYVYRIEVDAGRALAADRVMRRQKDGQTVALHPVRVNEDLGYSFSTATEDPWYAAMLRYPWGPLDYSVSVDVDDALATDRPGRVEVLLTARTSFPEVNPDHRIRVRVNGEVVLEREADGNQALTLVGEVPAGVLAPGDNTVTVELPGGTAAPFEIVMVDRVALWYPRTLAAMDDRLHVEDAVTASGLQGSGFTNSGLVGYARSGEGRLHELRVDARRNRGSWTATVPTVSSTPGVEAVEYWMSTTSGLNRPEVLGTVEAEDLLADAADFLLIVHPSFMPEAGDASHPLNGYMERRQSQGWRVRAVALDAIQNAYGGGMALPGAVTSFLAAADEAFDYSHVLLVGDDSYDYLDNLGLGSVSFIPTVYTKANVITHSPSDGLLTDLDGDGLSDKAVGRWPVRTLTDLEVMVRKTLDWEDSLSGPRDARTSVWVTDSEDPSVASFEAQAERMIGTLETPLAGGGGEPWPAENISRVYFDEVSAEAGLSVAQTARGELLEALSAGQTVTGFVGHGSPTAWTFQGLLGPQHVNEMDNEGRPTLITTLTCYTSYFVSPNTDTLAHRLMKGYRTDGQGNEIPGVANGAVAVHGAATLSGYTDNESLARRALAHQLKDGDTLGEAIRKARVAAFEAGQLDTAKNWALLGDPTLTIGQ